MFPSFLPFSAWIKFSLLSRRAFPGQHIQKRRNLVFETSPPTTQSQGVYHFRAPKRAEGNSNKKWKYQIYKMHECISFTWQRAGENLLHCTCENFKNCHKTLSMTMARIKGKNEETSSYATASSSPWGHTPVSSTAYMRKKKMKKKRVKQLKHVLDTRYMMLIQGLGDFVLCVSGEMWCKSKLGMLKSQFFEVKRKREPCTTIYCTMLTSTSIIVILNETLPKEWGHFSSNSYFIYLVNFWEHLHPISIFSMSQCHCQWNVYQIRLIQNWSFTFM